MAVIHGSGAPEWDAAVVKVVNISWAFCPVSGLSNVCCEKGQPAPAVYVPDGDKA